MIKSNGFQLKGITDLLPAEALDRTKKYPLKLTKKHIDYFRAGIFLYLCDKKADLKAICLNYLEQDCRYAVQPRAPRVAKKLTTILEEFR